MYHLNKTGLDLREVTTQHIVNEALFGHLPEVGSVLPLFIEMIRGNPQNTQILTLKPLPLCLSGPIFSTLQKILPWLFGNIADSSQKRVVERFLEGADPSRSTGTKTLPEDFPQLIKEVHVSLLGRNWDLL